MKERAREKESKTERECEQDRDIKKRREKVGERKWEREREIYMHCWSRFKAGLSVSQIWNGFFFHAPSEQ